MHYAVNSRCVCVCACVCACVQVFKVLFDPVSLFLKPFVITHCQKLITVEADAYAASPTLVLRVLNQLCSSLVLV